jgi:hypothetical protein
MAISLDNPGDQAPLDPKLVKLTSDVFLSELYAKAYEYYVQANTFKSVKGKLFEKSVVHSELWQAMKYLRFEEITGSQESREELRRIMEVDEMPLSQSEVFISRYCLEAVRKGDWAAIEDASKLLKMMGENPALHPGKVPWHYYVGMAAYELLLMELRPGFKGLGHLPTKKDVKKRAIDKRKKAEGGKYDPPERWDRIFKDLGLKDLPSAQGS